LSVVGLRGCAFFILRRGGDFFKFNFFWELKVEALLQALVFAWACAAC